jgi:photosynthetic reaction center H subunit
MRNENEMDRVVPITQLSDFQVADKDPDVRGWDVLSADGARIGEVENLLVDTAALKVRYLDVEVDRDLLHGDRDRERHVLVPIGYARLERDDNRVVVETLQSSDVSNLPEYRQEPITRDYETSVRSSWDREYRGTAADDAEFYNDPLYDDQRFFDSGRENPLA